MRRTAADVGRISRGQVKHEVIMDLGEKLSHVLYNHPAFEYLDVSTQERVSDGTISTLEAIAELDRKHRSDEDVRAFWGYSVSGAYPAERKLRLDLEARLGNKK